MKTKAFSKLIIFSTLAMMVMAGCSGSKGETGAQGPAGPTGAAGPTMPVIQSTNVYGLPALPGSSITAVVLAQSAQNLALTYSWTTSSGWGIKSGGTSPTVTIKAIGGYDATGYAMVTVSDTQSRSATGVVILNTLYGGWGAAAAIETNLTNASSPQVSFDSAGNAIAVWYQSDGTYNSIYANRYVAGTGWGAAAIIDAGPNNAWNPQVSFDSAGNAIAVWQQSDGTHDRIYANRYVAGTGWGAAAIIDAGPNNAWNPQVSFDSAGNAIAVWMQSDGTYYRIYANRYVAGTGWGAVAAIETNLTNADSPQVSFDSAGNAIAVWYQSDGTHGRIYANRYVAGTGWGAAAIIDAGPNNALHPQVSFDRAGNAIAVWDQSDGTYDRIYANRYVAGTGWSVAAIIDAGIIAANPYNAFNPQVSFDKAGNAIAVWFQWDGTQFRIYANRYVAGTGWGAAAAIETNPNNALHPQVSFDRAGNAIAVWEQDDGIYNRIYANRYVAGTGWGAAAIIDAGPNGALHPQVSFDSAGNAIAVWDQWDGTYYRIYANRFQ